MTITDGRPTSICRACAKGGKLQFRPCPNHSVFGDPAKCAHDFRGVILGQIKVGWHDCPAAICLDCGTQIKCQGDWH